VPRPPRRIGIVGGGDLGSRLAARFVRAGHEVVVQGDGAAGADRATRRVRERLAELARRGGISAGGVQRLARDVRVTGQWAGLGTAVTDPGTLAATLDWVRRWGFIPVRVGDRPGRLVEHVRTAYLSEGVALVAEGLPVARIDAGCRRFGMARGPLEWCDVVGLD